MATDNEMFCLRSLYPGEIQNLILKNTHFAARSRSSKYLGAFSMDAASLSIELTMDFKVSRCSN